MFKSKFKHDILTKEQSSIDVLGLTKGAQAAYVWDFFNESKRDVIVVTSTIYEANTLYKNLSNLENVYFFPADDFLASEASLSSPDLMSKRLEVLNEIPYNNEKKLIITNLMGYLRFLPTKNTWMSLKLEIDNKSIIDRTELLRKLDILGYKKDTLVTKTGDYASRGFVLDIYPFGYDNPVRIEFFDNEVDKIKIFDPETQMTNNEINFVSILPFTEFINNTNEEYPSRQSLLPIVQKEVSSIDKYLNNPYYVFFDVENLKQSYSKTFEEIVEFKKTDEYKIENYMYDISFLTDKCYTNIVTLDNFDNKKVKEVYNTGEIECLNGNYDAINKFIKKAFLKKQNVIICIHSKNINSVAKNIKSQTVMTDFENIIDGVVNIVDIDMESGFILDNDIYLTKKELFGDTGLKKYKSKFRYGAKIKDINKLKVGDFVVHEAYGIGKYLGIVTLKSKKLIKDYLYLEYKNNDKLYIPVEKIELISKYSSNEGAVPSLSKLGGTDWQRQKLRIKGKVKEIAQDLINLSAKRKLIHGFSFYKDDEEQAIFESAFEYTETKDQLKASEEIKKDMEMPYPMDRLLCGDVGYGKTEVAFRAAYKAIRSGKQVAILCPTTILSNQHYESAKERFEKFGVNIGLINRFTKEKDKSLLLEDVRSGKIDLLIGTHRLLSKDIEYKDLGLLIIDEEQRFGVTHKERIKEYKSSIDVLTLSATPIPRTLQMSLTGIRGLSLIETPPVDRFPIQTYVLKENQQVIKDAIYKEMARDGQVFILYNSVSKIEDEVSKIQKLVPEAKITYVHGRMNKEEIESSMNSFINKDYDVLVCTTIIETGIDIPNVNTLVVIDADFFGLSQLYQIRGRIGRSKQIAYAYLMYNPNKELNDTAIKRLNAIKEFTELGSGYAIAVRDLAIRGAGNILGSEQSGFIDTIGYDMYIKILNEEVEKIKGTYKKELEYEEDIKPFLQVSTHVSDMYAEDEDIKIEIHKKINAIDSYDSYNNIKYELEDRFGVLNSDMLNYMKEELFQSFAIKKNVIKVIQEEGSITVMIKKEELNDDYLNSLYINLYDIDKSFSVNSTGNILKIKLDIKNKDNYIDILIKMLEYI